MPTPRANLLRARSITSRTSFTPLEVALNSTKDLPVLTETTCAKVVFPLPGGPHKIKEVAANLFSSSAIKSPLSGESALVTWG